VGVKFDFRIEAGHVLLFARAVGAFDVDLESLARSSAIVPLPTFLAATNHFNPEFRLRPRPGQPWPPLSPSAVRLHAGQTFDFRRPLLVGEVLHVETVDQTRAWEKASATGGTLVFGEQLTEYRDTSGDIAATSTSVTVATR
jgi:hypothetical protein